MQKPDETLVRDAVSADAAGIARVHVDSWRQTYSETLDESFFSEEAFQRRLEFWGRYLAMAPRPGRLVVAEREGAIIGFGNAGEARGPDALHGFAPARSTHLFCLYLLTSAHGLGIGRSLLDAVLGEVPAQLWVARGNDRAIAFYRRNGFEFDGVEFAEPSAPNLVELRMVR